MKTLRLACLIAAVAPLAGCTPPTHNAVSGLGDCFEPPPGVDAAVPRECQDAPSQNESGAWLDCIVAMYDARPNEPCSFAEGGFCAGREMWDRAVSATCIEGRITRFDVLYTAPPDECTPSDFEVAGSCLENGCVSICPGEPVPPTESAVTWNVDDETSCQALLAEIPQAGEPCTGSGWCQGWHSYETDPEGGYLGDTFVAFCGAHGLAIIRHDEIPGRPFYGLED